MGPKLSVSFWWINKGHIKGDYYFTYVCLMTWKIQYYLIVIWRDAIKWLIGDSDTGHHSFGQTVLLDNVHWGCWPGLDVGGGKNADLSGCKSGLSLQIQVKLSWNSQHIHHITLSHQDSKKQNKNNTFSQVKKKLAQKTLRIKGNRNVWFKFWSLL